LHVYTENEPFSFYYLLSIYLQCKLVTSRQLGSCEEVGATELHSCSFQIPNPKYSQLRKLTSYDDMLMVCIAVAQSDVNDIPITAVDSKCFTARRFTYFASRIQA